MGSDASVRPYSASPRGVRMALVQDVEVPNGAFAVLVDLVGVTPGTLEALFP